MASGEICKRILIKYKAFIQPYTHITKGKHEKSMKIRVLCSFCNRHTSKDLDSSHEVSDPSLTARNCVQIVLRWHQKGVKNSISTYPEFLLSKIILVIFRFYHLILLSSIFSDISVTLHDYPLSQIPISTSNLNISVSLVSSASTL